MKHNELRLTQRHKDTEVRTDQRAAILRGFVSPCELTLVPAVGRAGNSVAIMGFLRVLRGWEGRGA